MVYNLVQDEMGLGMFSIAYHELNYEIFQQKQLSNLQDEVKLRATVRNLIALLYRDNSM